MWANGELRYSNRNQITEDPTGRCTTPDTCRRRTKSGIPTAHRPDQVQNRRNNTRKRNIHDAKPHQTSRCENQKRNQTWKLVSREIFRNIPFAPEIKTQLWNPHDKKHNDIWTTRQRPTENPPEPDGGIHVQAPTHDDEYTL